MNSSVFPNRRLGSSENWGRQVETEIRNAGKTISLISQTLDNLERQSRSKGGVVSRQIQKLLSSTLTAERQNTVLNERISSDKVRSSVTLNSFGSQVSVRKPEWARAVVVVAGLSAVSNPGVGWLARIDLYAETDPISSGNISEHRVVAQGSMGFDPQSPVDPPDHLSFESLPGVRFFNEDASDLYIRPYGLQVGGGSTTASHQIEISYTLFWV